MVLTLGIAVVALRSYYTGSCSKLIFNGRHRELLYARSSPFGFPAFKRGFERGSEQTTNPAR